MKPQDLKFPCHPTPNAFDRPEPLAIAKLTLEHDIFELGEGIDAAQGGKLGR